MLLELFFKNRFIICYYKPASLMSTFIPAVVREFSCKFHYITRSPDVLLHRSLPQTIQYHCKF